MTHFFLQSVYNIFPIIYPLHLLLNTKIHLKSVNVLLKYIARYSSLEENGERGTENK